MLEIWTQWKPIEGLFNKYYIDIVLSDQNGFKILLIAYENEQHQVEVIYENWVDSYRLTNESNRIQLIHKLSEQYGTSFYADWTLFKVENSEYLSWVIKESCGLADPLDFLHFTFIGVDQILDVVATYDPVVTLTHKK